MRSLRATSIRRVFPRLRSWLLAMLLACSVASLMPAVSRAQPAPRAPTVVVRGAPTCAGCRVILREVGSFSDDVYDADLRFVRVLGGPGSSLLIAGRDGSLALFTASLRFERVFSRAGSGPGESRLPVISRRMPGDSIAIADWGLQRVTVYAPDGSRAVRTLPVPRHRDLLPLPGGQFMLSGFLAQPETAGLPLHRIVGSGVLGGSFGSAATSVTRDAERLLSRSLAAYTDGRFLAARTDRYRIEQWSVAGVLERVLEREASWFPPAPDAGRTPNFRVARPWPTLTLQAYDPAAQAVWVTSAIAASDWQPDAAASTRGDEVASTREPMSVYVHRFHETVFELLDADNGRVLTARRERGVFAPVAGTPLVWKAEERTDGSILVRVYRLEVEGLPTHPRGARDR